MAEVSVPAPVAVAGGVLVLLGGYLIGAVAHPAGSDQSMATVLSYDRDDDRLCLEGEAAADDPASRDGVLCGVWRRNQGARVPRPGDDFRFVTITSSGDRADETATYIYGDAPR